MLKLLFESAADVQREHVCICSRHRCCCLHSFRAASSLRQSEAMMNDGFWGGLRLRKDGVRCSVTLGLGLKVDCFQSDL